MLHRRRQFRNGKQIAREMRQLEARQQERRVAAAAAWDALSPTIKARCLQLDRAPRLRAAHWQREERAFAAQLARLCVRDLATRDPRLQPPAPPARDGSQRLPISRADEQRSREFSDMLRASRSLPTPELVAFRQALIDALYTRPAAIRAIDDAEAAGQMKRADASVVRRETEREFERLQLVAERCTAELEARDDAAHSTIAPATYPELYALRQRGKTITTPPVEF